MANLETGFNINKTVFKEIMFKKRLLSRKIIIDHLHKHDIHSLSNKLISKFDLLDQSSLDVVTIV